MALPTLEPNKARRHMALLPLRPGARAKGALTDARRSVDGPPVVALIAGGATRLARLKVARRVGVLPPTGVPRAVGRAKGGVRPLAPGAKSRRDTVITRKTAPRPKGDPATRPRRRGAKVIPKVVNIGTNRPP